MKKIIMKGLVPYALAAFLIAIFYSPVLGQGTFEVSGIVNSHQTPLTGVTVREKGTNNATLTKEDGSYSLHVSGPNATLTFSYIGFKTETVEVSGKHHINVSLTASSQELSGLVVTALGITRQKSALGYSIDEVSGKEMTEVPHENVLTALEGKVSGVTINQTGGVGSSVSMVIRGANSLSNDNQPLFVVDGVPIANSLNNISSVGSGNDIDFGNAISSINPDDIASVTILKGPSAAALYGSRAGNGVVLITTKSGSNVNRLTVTVSTSTVFDIPYKYLKWQTQYGSGLFSAIPVSLTGNILTNPFGSLIDESSGGYGGAELNMGYKDVLWNSPLDANGKPIPMPLVSHPHNIQDFLQTGITSQNSVSVANNTESINYRISYSNMTNRGIIPNTDLFRNTLDLSSSLKINSKLRLSTNIDLSRNNSDNRPSTGKGTNPLQWAYAVGPEIDINDLKDYWEPGQVGIQQRTQYNGLYNNPWFLANEVKNSFKRDRLYGNVKLDWQIIPDLSLMLRYGLDTYNEERDMKVPYSVVDDPRGAFGLINIKSFESNADFLLTYKKDFQNFSLSASAGGNIRFQSNSTVNNSSLPGTGLVVPGVYTIQNILPANLYYNSYLYQRQVNSLYGLATLGYKEMIFLDVTGRNDWSSTLPGAAPYFYPSASLSLLINEMAGITSNNINLIKLRGGIAQVGNDATPYQLQSVLQDAGTWNNIPRLTTSPTLLNPDLKPESITSYEGGVDIHLFKDRIRFSGTYYMVEDKNQIFTTQLPSSSGYTSKNINAGMVRSRGIELTLGLTPVQSKNWNWDINLNLTRSRTKVVSLPNEMPYFDFWEEAKGGAWTYVGEDVGTIYGPSVVTVTDKSSPYYGYPLLSTSDGGAKWQSIDAHNTKNVIGNFNPNFIMGMQTSLSYKSFSLNMTFDWRDGGDFVSQTYRYGMENGNAAIQFNQFINAGNMSGKQLRDYLVAHADQDIIINGNHFPRVGWPTPEKTSYPFQYGSYKLPYGGMFIPGVVAKGYDANGNPTGYIENLGENILNQDHSNPNYTMPLPYAAADPWDFLQAFTFPASYIKLREISFSWQLPQHWIKSLKLQNASLSVYSRDIILWTKAKINIDPERAFEATTGDHGGSQFEQGIELYNVMPWVMPVGFKLNVVF